MEHFEKIVTAVVNSELAEYWLLGCGVGIILGAWLQRVMDRR